MNWLMKPLPAALLLVLLWTGGRLVFLMEGGIPAPQVHDEFSYLLGADTFAHGRLTNPPHPLAKFFESPHEIFHPTYASKYPPGQAMFLALGQRLFGSPFYGVLIGNAFMLFTFCLMLYAWVPPPWAIAVSVMFGLILSPDMYWTNSYWGGSVAASGGALVLLGIGTYRKKAGASAGAIFGIGILLLFWTRPFEGGLFTVAVLIVLTKDLWIRRRASAFAAALSFLAAGGIWTCYYNWTVTGNPLLLPYMLHVRQYDVAPVLWFLPVRPEPAYSHPRLGALHGNEGWEMLSYRDNRSWRRRIRFNLMNVLRNLETALQIALALTLLFPVAWRSQTFRSMVIISGTFLLALSIETFHFEHYEAPVWAAFALMIAVWFEHAWQIRFKKLRVGIALVLLIMVLPIILRPPHLFGLLREVFEKRSKNASVEIAIDDFADQRVALIARLSQLQQKQLLIVRYPEPDWNVDEEWVYNSADIDGQRVVFAHDLGEEQDRALLDYYPDRAALLLTFNPESGQEQIEPYRGEAPRH
jgi:hypothetical protein